MSKLTKREQLEKNVVDTAAASNAAYDADAAWVAAWDAAKAKLELNKYLKEQDNE